MPEGKKSVVFLKEIQNLLQIALIYEEKEKEWQVGQKSARHSGEPRFVCLYDLCQEQMSSL